MSVVYDGPLPPGRAASKKARAPAASSVPEPPPAPAPASSSATAGANQDYDGPLPPAKSASRTAPAAPRSAAPSRPLPRSVTAQPQRAAANGRAAAPNGSATTSSGARTFPALQRAFSDRLPGQQTAPPAAGGRDIADDIESLAGPALTTFIPSLNAYVKAKIGKTGEAGEYIEAVTALGPLGNPKQVAVFALPRLALFGALPPSLVPQLLPFTLAEDRRAAQLAYHLLQVQLGIGIAGTPTLPPTKGGELITADPVPIEVAARGWQAVMDPDSGHWQLQAAVRTLSAAARSSPKPLARDLATAVGIVMDRASKVNPLEAPGKRAAEDMGALKRIAIAATRVAVEPRSAIAIARSNLRQVASADPVTARHALGLAIHAARKDARYVVDGLAELVLDALQLYEMAGAAAFAPKKAVKGATPVSEDGINLSDPFTRVYMARLCAAVVFSAGAGAGISGVAASFYQLLTLLATRDESPLVGVGAIRALAGWVPPKVAKLQAEGDAPLEDVSDLRMRSRAWQVLLSQAGAPASGPIPDGAATLIGVLGERLTAALQRNSPAMVCSALQAAGAIGEARARSSVRGLRGKKYAEVNAVMEELADDLQRVAEGPAGPPVRCRALEALFWFQLPGLPARITPSSLLRNVTSSAAGSAAWSKDLLESLLATILRAERAIPDQAQLLMACAGAVAAASPSAVNLSRVVDMWTNALKAGKKGKEAALRAAMGILSSQPPPSANAATGARQEELAQAAAEGAAWIDFQRMAAWWLGEHANVATDEYAGSSGIASSPAEDDVLATSGFGRVVINTENKHLSAGEVIALQASENPAMMAVVSQLQHAIMTMPWPIRCAAAQATAKVAVRSEEPYRIHCYSILRSLAASDLTLGHDFLGVATLVAPAVRLLDKIYATRVTLEDLSSKYGDQPLQWPVHVVEQLRERNTAILAAIEGSICALPSGLYYPLGPVGKELLKAAATMGLEAFLGGSEHAAAKDAAEQAALDADGKPAWLRGLMDGDEGGADLLQEQAGASSEEEEDDSDAQPSSLALPTMDESGLDALAAEMAKLDRAIAGPVLERPPWMQRPTAAELAAAAAVQATSTPTHRSQHSRTSSFDFAASVKELEGTGIVLHDFDGADEQELTVFAEQQVTLHHEADGWIMCSTEAGRKGLVPAAYIRVTKSKPRDDPFASTDDAFGADDPFAGPSGRPAQAYDPFDDPFAAQPQGSGEAAADPFAEPREINRVISIGDSISGQAADDPALARERPEWASVQDIRTDASDQNGGSPVRSGSRVRAPLPETLEISPRFIAANAAAITEERSSEDGDAAVEEATARPASVLFAFEPETEDELGVVVGDDVQVLGDEVDGWYNVQSADGRRGLVPSTYIEIRN